jgi:hypothetical protein
LNLLYLRRNQLLFVALLLNLPYMPDRVPAIPEQKATRTSVNPPNFGPKPDRNQTVTV